MFPFSAFPFAKQALCNLRKDIKFVHRPIFLEDFIETNHHNSIQFFFFFFKKIYTECKFDKVQTPDWSGERVCYS